MISLSLSKYIVVICMRYYFLLILITALLSSCSKNSSYECFFDDVDSLIENRPDSALAVLCGMDLSLIDNRELQARYALLLSMAQDKNYIDKTDFSTLQPAIDYYEDNGGATERMRMLYYKGRIYRNMGNEVDAMECYISGIENGKSSNDILTLARLYFSKGQINHGLYNYNGYCSDMLKSAQLFEKSGRTSSQVNALLHAANGYHFNEKSDSAAIVLTLARNLMDDSNLKQLADYYNLKIMMLCENLCNHHLEDILCEYLTKIPADKTDWLNIAAAYYYNGQFNKGNEALCRYEKMQGERTLRYFAIKSQLCESVGNDIEALNNYRLYVKMQDSLDMLVFNNNVKLLEDKHHMQFMLEREKTQKTIGIMIAILLFMAIISISVHTRNLLNIKKIERDRFYYKCMHLEKEKSELEDILEKNKSIDSNARKILMERVELLNKFLVANISHKEKHESTALKEVEQLLKARNEFIVSNIGIYEASYPQFIRFLRDKKLSEVEIGYCCLYAIGLRINDVGGYLNTRSHYNVNIEIRRKLGLDTTTTNLDIYIRNILHKI